jgi:hypothetical protein
VPRHIFLRTAATAAAITALTAAFVMPAHAATTSYAPKPGIAASIEASTVDGGRITHSSGRDNALAWADRNSTSTSTTVYTRTTTQSVPQPRVTIASANKRVIVASGGGDAFYTATADDTKDASGRLTNTSLALAGSGASTQTTTVTDPYIRQAVFVSANGGHAVVVQHLTDATDGTLTRTWRHTPTGWVELAETPGISSAAISLDVADDGTAAMTASVTASNGNVSAVITVATGTSWTPLQTLAWSSRSAVNGSVYRSVSTISALFTPSGLTAIWSAGTGTAGAAGNGVYASTYTPGSNTWSTPRRQTLKSATDQTVTHPATASSLAGTTITFTRADSTVLYDGPVLVNDSLVYTLDAGTWREWPKLSSSVINPTNGALNTGVSSSLAPVGQTRVGIVAPDTAAPVVTAAPTSSTSNSLTAADNDQLQAVSSCQVTHTPWGGTASAPSTANTRTSALACSWNSYDAPSGTYALTGTFPDRAGNTTTDTVTWTVGAPPTTNPDPDPTDPGGPGDEDPTDPSDSDDLPTHVEDSPAFSPTITTNRQSTVLGRNVTKAVWSSTTNLSDPTFYRDVTTYDHQGKRTSFATNLPGDGQYSRKVPGGSTVCVTTYAKNTHRQTPATGPVCRTALLDAAKSRSVKVSGTTKTANRKSAHGHKLLALSPKKGRSKAGKVTFTVRKGASIRLTSSGKGKAEVVVAGKRWSVSGNGAKGRTFKAKKNGKVTVTAAGGRGSAFTLDSFTITYR